MKIASATPAAYNFLAANPRTGKLIKQLAGFAPDRSLPALGKTTVHHWYQEKARQNRFFPKRTRVSVL
jgi:hypothetical protein